MANPHHCAIILAHLGLDPGRDVTSQFVTQGQAAHPSRCICAAVASLSGKVGLQYAMLIVPACYAASGIAFVGAEAMMEQDAAVEKAAALRERSKAKARKEPRVLSK